MDDRVAAIYTRELEPELCMELFESDLAAVVPRESIGHRADRGRLVAQRSWGSDARELVSEGAWLIMHRDLVWIYKCLLSASIAKDNRLILATDQAAAHAAASGYSARELVVGGISDQASVGGLATTFGLLASKSVIPADIASVPMEKIVSLRSRFGDAFDAWRDHVDGVGNELSQQLASVESPTILNQYLAEAARRYADAPVKRLREGLSEVGLGSVDVALNTKFQAPAALGALGLATGNPIAVAAGVAVGLVEIRRDIRSKARLHLASPSSYLLSVRETLEPQSWIKRVVGLLRSVVGLRG